MAGNQDMDELFSAHQGLKSIGCEMDAPIANQKEQVRRQQDAQGLDDHLCGDTGAGDEEGQAQALAGAVVGDDQNGDPGGHNGQLGPALAKSQPFLLPSLVCLLSLGQGFLSLVAQGSPVAAWAFRSDGVLLMRCFSGSVVHFSAAARPHLRLDAAPGRFDGRPAVLSLPAEMHVWSP